MLTIDEKIALFRTTKAQYDKYQRELIHLGFNKEQVDIILDGCLFQAHKSIEKVVHFLKEFSDFLLQYFSHKHLTTIIHNDSNLLKLSALINYTKVLIQYGFKAQDIVSILNYEKGEDTIATVMFHFSELHNRLKFSRKSIVEAASIRD